MSARRCAVCHDRARGELCACRECGVVAHADCRAWLGRCPTLGCLPRCAGTDRPLGWAGQALVAGLRWLGRTS